jgi:curli biogenesis system outer membrane secretion channel CsgG
MKRILVLFLVLCAITAHGQSGKPATKTETSKPLKVAVYITGEDTIKLSGFAGDYLVDAIVRSGKYTAVERTYDFLKELNNEQEYQRTGSVNDEQISKLGRQFGVSLVCIVKVGNVSAEEYYLSARLIDVETATVIKSAKPLTFTVDNLSDACENITKQLFGSDMARTFGKPKKVEQ